ncbi:TatD family hydrolase [Candidatus Nanosyncoccus alces]|uniref:Metal-dependent hydrolase YcfH n=1 Tax=Candidatus Nanosyncoccus alces TaxID=2171997 RepID=A0ABY0FNK9_9BACT|nr:TatD family hydrolase [Candidatus Nanosyncoccus alces]RYC74470.1 putative metal-dependent hydrolase YcfH [Candidatus Nanosyncoccus alces]
MLIDAHCHLHDREFFSAEQAEEMLKRAHEKGVEKIICIGTSHEDSLAARDFAVEHGDTYWTYGVHPEFAGKEDWTFEGTPVAIGEVGLDYHYSSYNRTAQIHLFEQMLQLANDHNLPVSFHVREAFDDFFPVVTNFSKIRGVVHSFSDNKKNLKRVLAETDFYIGVNGMATYSTLPTPPIERIILETDAPFLTPEPFRGIINEPSYVPAIAKWLSTKLGLDYQIVERKTTENARQLFNI